MGLAEKALRAPLDSLTGVQHHQDSSDAVLRLFAIAAGASGERTDGSQQIDMR